MARPTDWMEFVQVSSQEVYSLPQADMARGHGTGKHCTATSGISATTS